jgi:hypothetical protein
MQKYLPEIFKEINENPKEIAKYKGDPSITMLLKYAFMPQHKFNLPEGEPPFKPDAAPIGMSPAVLRQELRRLYVFCRDDLKPIKRETLFVSLLESVHPSEAELLIAVKDQKLHKLYKKITKKLVIENGFVPPETPGDSD